jgi:hypothetical protein
MGNVIDWSKMHRPQADGYDTEMVRQLAVERYGFRKAYPKVGEPSMFNGKLALIHEKDQAAAWLINAPFDHPNILKTEALMYEVWPEMAAQCEALLQSVWILLDKNQHRDDLSGGTCGNHGPFGGICTTVQGVLGFGHGLIHELGHWKLHAMGVHLEDWDNLVANEFTEMFESPIRKDKPRPMGACIQAQYSYLNVLEWEIRCWKAGVKSDMMALNVTRMSAGRETLKAWRPDANGEAFAAAMDAWTEELITEANSLL